jgi:hypothetical protein
LPKISPKLPLDDAAEKPAEKDEVTKIQGKVNKDKSCTTEWDLAKPPFNHCRYK